jgi:hypothetical protein
MFDKIQGIIGSLGGLDIGVIVASLGYVAKCGTEIVQWLRDRKEQRIDQTILDAIQWVYINGVREQKANGNGLTIEQGNAALAAASEKAVLLAAKAGLDLEREVGADNIPSRVQSVFAQFKAALTPGNKQEVLSNE